jgi:hypothetical protein
VHPNQKIIKYAFGFVAAVNLLVAAVAALDWLR